MNIKENLVRFAHPPEAENDGTMELWNDGLWPPARRAYGSERILQCGVNGNNRLDDKIKNG